MAYSVDWIAKVVTIPVSDLTLVSGTRYSLPMADFLAECRRLEWEFTEGLWAPPILDHTNAKIDFAGADYAGFDEVVNGYTITFSAPATRVDLAGSNNNIIDVLNVNGISVVPSNSAGLQRVTSGSGLDATQDAKLTLVANNSAYHNKIIDNVKELVKDGNSWYLVIYDDGEVSGGIEILRKKQTDKDGNDITDLVAGTLAAELENSV